MSHLIRKPLSKLQPKDMIGVRQVSQHNSTMLMQVMEIEDGYIYAVSKKGQLGRHIFAQADGSCYPLDAGLEIYMTPERRVHLAHRDSDRRYINSEEWTS